MNMFSLYLCMGWILYREVPQRLKKVFLLLSARSWSTCRLNIDSSPWGACVVNCWGNSSLVFRELSLQEKYLCGSGCVPAGARDERNTCHSRDICSPGCGSSRASRRQAWTHTPYRNGDSDGLSCHPVIDGSGGDVRGYWRCCNVFRSQGSRAPPTETSVPLENINSETFVELFFQFTIYPDSNQTNSDCGLLGCDNM